MEATVREEDPGTRITRTVPASIVPYLRRGLLGELGFAAEELAHLLLASDDQAPDAAFPSPLHTLLTILIPLGEIGWQKADVPRDVVINLEIGGAYVVNGLREELLALERQLSVRLKSESIARATRNTASAKLAEFGEFVRVVEEQVNRLNRQRRTSIPTSSDTRPPLRDKSSQARQPRR